MLMMIMIIAFIDVAGVLSVLWLLADWCPPPGEDWSRHRKSIRWSGICWLWLRQQQQVQDKCCLYALFSFK